MNTKKFIFVFGLLFAVSIGFAFADSSTSMTAPVDAVPASAPADVDTAVAAVELSDGTTTDAIVAETPAEAVAAPVQVIVVDQSAVDKRAVAKTGVGGRVDTARANASITATVAAAADKTATAVAPAAPAAVATTTVVTPAAAPTTQAAVAMLTTKTVPIIRAPALAVATPTATTTTTAASNLECNPGEYPSGSACVKCSQKNNPGVDWANPGKDCKITACISDDYFLYGADTTQPQCLKKCDIWGGKASKAWKVDDWDICGSGAGIDCDDGFIKTREQTSSSGVQFWHCIPKGTMSGSCSKPGKVNICDFPNGKAKQYCENGFWGNCNITKLCNTGYVEAASRQVTTVINGADSKTGIFDCVAK